MPHVVNKAIFFSYLDSRYSQINGLDPSERLEILNELYDPNPNLFERFSTLKPTKATTDGAMATPDLPASTDRMKHLYEHWFGYENTAPGQAPAQWSEEAVADSTPTGWWSQWHGNAHDIFAETLRRAIEVSLGIDHPPSAGSTNSPPPPPVPPIPTRLWPISFLWICGSPKFEGWIEWRQFDAASPIGGHVQVIFTTPGISSDVGGSAAAISRRLTYDTSMPAGQIIHDEDNYVAGPTSTVGQTNGMWVIGHDLSYVPSAPPCKIENDFNLIDDLPGVVFGSGPVVVVRPAEVDGGVLNLGRQW